MYPLQPVVRLPPKCSRTTTMYEMRNIHEDLWRRHNIDAKTFDDIVTEQKPMPEYSALEARQEKILDQLAELKKHMHKLCNFLNQSNQIEATKEKLNNSASNEGYSVKKPRKAQVMVYVDPERPPYSILALKKLWKDIDIRLISFIHSTIQEPVPFHFSSATEFTANNVICLSLIWKKVDNLQFILKLKSYPLIGEVNLLRYLSRLTDTHNYEEPWTRPNSDSILDLCYFLALEKDFKELRKKLSKINDLIGFADITKCEPSIVDIAVWSTIKQLTPAISSNKLPENIRDVYEFFEKTMADTLAHNEQL